MSFRAAAQDVRLTGPLGLASASFEDRRASGSKWYTVPAWDKVAAHWNKGEN